MTTELQRVLQLPERDQGTLPPLSPLLEAWSERGLWPVQIEALATLAAQPAPLGIYGDVPVGGGKFLIATLAGTVVRAERPLVLTQPDLLRQAASEYNSFQARFPEVRQHKPEYMSYSMLSQQGSGKLLWKIAPDLIALDEAHAVAARDSARTRRLLDYVVEHPSTRVVVLSGTLNRKSLLDIAHLAEMALREHMWLPIREEILRAWAQILDHKVDPGTALRKQYLGDLLKWAVERGFDTAGLDEPAQYLGAYRMRYLRTPGVIAPPETEVSASLVLHQWRPEAPPVVHEALKNMSETWTLPDGTELVDALEYWRHASTLSVGFYYRPIWDGDVERLVEWQDTRTAWARALRRQLLYIRQPGLDSPANVERACEGSWAHPDTVTAYRAWVAVRDVVAPRSEAVWLSEALVDEVVARAREHGRCLIWYESATALEPLFRARGIPVYGAGSSAPQPGVKIAALSRHVHGTGKNLQAWDCQIVMEPSSSATTWEQLLGRTHRPGQLSDEVRADVLCATWIGRSRIYAAQAEAEYIAQTSNKRHKLTFCTWVS